MLQESHLESFSLPTSRFEIPRRTDCELDRQRLIIEENFIFIETKIGKQLIAGVYTLEPTQGIHTWPNLGNGIIYKR